MKFSEIGEYIKQSVLNDSNVSSLRIQAYLALAAAYGFWLLSNTSILISHLYVYIASRGVKGNDWAVWGWAEIITLTGGLIAGRVIQTFSPGDGPQKPKTEAK